MRQDLIDLEVEVKKITNRMNALKAEYDNLYSQANDKLDSFRTKLESEGVNFDDFTDEVVNKLEDLTMLLID